MTRKQLIKKHGTLEEFSKAVWNAYHHLEITYTEAKLGIEKYKEELNSKDIAKKDN